jgi:hypothetical protein
LEDAFLQLLSLLFCFSYAVLGLDRNFGLGLSGTLVRLGKAVRALREYPILRGETAKDGAPDA